MKPKEFEKRMKEIYYEFTNNEDEGEEDAHAVMDALMCELLISLGYEDGVDIFLKTKKWYC